MGRIAGNILMPISNMARQRITDVCQHLNRSGAASGIRILEYHRVNDHHSDDPLTVSTDQFAKQMAWLAEAGYRPLYLEQVVLAVRNRWRPAEKVVAITLNGGYADNYWNAYPILREHKFAATVFVAAGHVETRRLFPRYGEAELDRVLSWEELGAMKRGGVAVGTCIMDHPTLTRLPLEDARRDVEHSKAMIEERLGEPVRFAGYPCGMFDTRVRSLVQQAGYRGAVSNRVGANKIGTDYFALRRTGISPRDTLEDFEKKLSGAFDMIDRFGKVLPLRKLR